MTSAPTMPAIMYALLEPPSPVLAAAGSGGSMGAAVVRSS